MIGANEIGNYLPDSVFVGVLEHIHDFRVVRALEELE